MLLWSHIIASTSEMLLRLSALSTATHLPSASASSSIYFGDAKDGSTSSFAGMTTSFGSDLSLRGTASENGSKGSKPDMASLINVAFYPLEIISLAFFNVK